MLMSDLFIVLLLCLLPYIWWLDRGVKQHVYQLVVKYCKQQDILLLDDSVQQNKISFKRDEMGNLRIHRYFNFEFTSTGERRYSADLEFTKNTIVNMRLDAFQI